MNNHPIPQPDTVYQLFRKLNNVPRPSWHEEKVADWLCQFAVDNQLDYQRDAHNCVVIRKAASPGKEGCEPIVLHAHMDMVCVAEKGKDFDPLTSPIEAYIDNGWMKARGTSLGADNGMGLCMAMAVMKDKSLVHGPLELLVTTNEEDGMTGAANLSEDFVKARKMIDLDSEDYDTITVGAAGAYLQTASLPLSFVPAPQDTVFAQVSIHGGLGGHSGVDINKQRMSAVKEICLLADQLLATNKMSVASIQAGEANASIPSSAEMVIGIAPDAADEIIDRIRHYEIKKAGDPNIKVEVSSAAPCQQVLSGDCVQALIDSIGEIPFGMIKMSEQMPGTVETSNNIGVIRMEEDHFHVTTHSRSFIDADMIALGERIRDIFEKHGATTRLIMSTPAWEENTQSDYMHLMEQTFIDVLGFRPRLVEMHFVMEMGYFVEKFKGIQIIPIGPRIIEPHSTSERVELSTIDNIWKVLIEVLCRLAQ